MFHQCGECQVAMSWDEQTSVALMDEDEGPGQGKGEQKGLSSQSQAFFQFMWTISVSNWTIKLAFNKQHSELSASWFYYFKQFLYQSFFLFFFSAQAKLSNKTWMTHKKNEKTSLFPLIVIYYLFIALTMWDEK